MVVSEQNKHALKILWSGPYITDSPAPVRPLTQMMNQEIVRGTTVSRNPLMATDLQVWGRHFHPKTNVDSTTNMH